MDTKKQKRREMTAERVFVAVLIEPIVVEDRVIPIGTLVTVLVGWRDYTITVMDGIFGGMVFYLAPDVARKCLRMV